VSDTRYCSCDPSHQWVCGN